MRENQKKREREREREYENWNWIKFIFLVMIVVVRILCITKSFCQFREIGKHMFWLGLEKFLLKFKIGEADGNVFIIRRKVLKCLFLYQVILGQTNFAYIFITILCGRQWPVVYHFHMNPSFFFSPFPISHIE